MRILENAHIRTLDPARPAVQALAVDHGVVIAAGSREEVRETAGPRAERVDLDGKTVWPGLTDAHLHLDFYSFGLAKVPCETATRAECLRRIAERAAATPPGEWVLGHGWNHNEWPEGLTPADFPAGLLDEAAPNHPVYLTSKSLHSGWANSLALQRAGLSAGSADPAGGALQRMPDGHLSGVLLESAMELVDDCLPEADEAQTAEIIGAAQRELWRLGITGVHDFDRRRCFAALQILDGAGRLRLRVHKSIPMDLLPQAAGLGLRAGFGSSFLRIGSVKLFADGALGPQTAAMLQPYEGSAAQTGMLLLDEEQIFELGCQAAGAGLGLAVHAIGDLANHAVLNAVAHLRAYEREHGLPARRHRIEHVQLLHPQDTARLAELDVIASMQPIHAISDMVTADRYWGARANLSYAWRTVLDSGARLAFGSDAPVEDPNPFLGLHAAVTRRRADGSPGPDGWYPEQRLALEEALHGYTTGAAYAAGREGELGRLAPGYAADLIVLPEDPFALPADALLSLRPLATMVAGEWVYGAGLAA